MILPRLVDLFARSFPAATIVPLTPALYAGPLDTHVPIGSLGVHLRPDWDAFRPPARGHLVADRTRTDALRARLAHDGRVIVGLSWRSVAPLRTLSPKDQSLKTAQPTRPVVGNHSLVSIC